MAAAFVGGALTALVTLLPPLHFAHRQHELHVGFATAAALIGLLASYLLFGRFQRRRRLDDLALFIALSLYALANLCFAAVPAMVFDVASTKFSTWAALSGRLLGTTAFALAAFLPPRPVHISPRARLLALLTPAGVLAATAVVVAGLVPVLPTGVEAELSPEPSGAPRLVAHPAILWVQLTAAVFFAAAALGFLRRGVRERDQFVRWLAVASVFGVFARVNYFLYPSLFTEWVYAGDWFRLLFYLVILAAALTEISSYWKLAANAAVLEERRRIARDLHDGLAQELAYVGRNLKRLGQDSLYVQRASAAVERGLEDARRAIAALADPIEGPLDAELARVAREVAEREGTTVELALAPDVDPPAETREALVRILSEAITNAARHGHADLVRVELENGNRLRLRITDTGRGFDPDAEQDAGRHRFGLRGMRERARPRRRTQAHDGARAGYAGRGGSVTENDGKIRVVIADDHAPTREDIRLALEEDGRFVVCAEAGDAAAAIATAVRERPDVCLLDINMAGGGIAAAWEITSRLPATKVVMLTISTEDRDLFGALRAGPATSSMTWSRRSFRARSPVWRAERPRSPHHSCAG